MRKRLCRQMYSTDNTTFEARVTKTPQSSLTSLQKLTMFSQSSLASPSSFRRRASTCMLSLLFRGFTTLRKVRYCWGVWHAAQCLALTSLSSVQAGQLHCPTLSCRFDEVEEEVELEEAVAEEEEGKPRACFRALWPEEDEEEEGVQEHAAVPVPAGRPQWVQQRDRGTCCS